jgi:hypothetical protein
MEKWEDLSLEYLVLGCCRPRRGSMLTLSLYVVVYEMKKVRLRLVGRGYWNSYSSGFLESFLPVSPLSYQRVYSSVDSSSTMPSPVWIG